MEGWAQLCPACVGRAGENGFLRFRLRQALAERGAAERGAAERGGMGPEPAAAPGAASSARATVERDHAPARGVDSPDDMDDRYLRRGRYARGPIHDAAWNAELDSAGRWLDALPIQGEIVELAAGTGWWSTLLAGRGTLSIYDERPERLDRARDRLLAHRLRAHLHVRDRWQPADRPVDVLFIGPELGAVPARDLGAFIRLVRGWLRPGGLFAAIDQLPDPHAAPDDGAAEPAGHPAAAVPAALQAAGFAAVESSVTGRFFALISARA